MSSGAGGGGRRAGSDETEIDSRPLVVERKRLYFNVRENPRGRFLKIAEVNRQRRSTVIIPQSGWVAMRNMLNEFIEAAGGEEAASVVPAAAAGAGRRKQAPVEPSAQLYVDNLPWATTSDELLPLFEEYGTVDRCETLTNNNGRPRGAAIVKFASQGEAEAAIEGLKDTSVGDRKLRVRYDRFPEGSKRRGGGGGGKEEEADGDGEDAGGMPLSVRSADGTVVSLTVLPISTVGDVLAAIADVEGLEAMAGRAQLSFQGRPLRPEAALSACGVTADAELQLSTN